MSATESAQPAVAAERRIAEIDIVRGFALLGILIVNVTVATMIWSFDGTGDDPGPHFDGAGDRLVYAVVESLFSGRFYLLFAFLFGYSFTLQVAAARRAEVAPYHRLLRRCVALFAIGLAHVLLLWIGDILTLYAVLCLILITLRNLRPRTAIIVGTVLYAGWSAWSLLPGSNGFDAIADLLDAIGVLDGYTGSFADTFSTQVHQAPLWLLLIWFTQGVPALGMFLIGMAAGERELLTDRETLRRWAPRALIIGLVVGLPVSAITFADTMNWCTPPSYWAGIQELTNPLMTFAYVAAVIMLTRHTRSAPVIGRLAPAGRMAASNYIMQSVVLMIVYTGYGFALADNIAPGGVIAIAVLTYAGQLAVSTWWLRTHPYGPVEWLLRTATYLSVPAWRR